VENGGVFFVKSGPFLNAGCIMHSISIFYFTFYLFGGVRTHPTHPPCLGPDLPRDGLINQSSDTAYSDVGYVLTDEAITQRDTLLLLTYVI